MQINFQFGTFEGTAGSFWCDLLVASLGAFIGIAGAYTIYYISIRRVRIDRLKYVVSLIESFISSTKRQAELCGEHSQSIINQPFANLKLPLIANRDIKRLADKVDQEGVYHAYLWKYRRQEKSYEDFKNLYGYIDYLDFLIDDMLNTNTRVIELMWKRKKQYQVSFRVLKELIQNLSLASEIAGELVEFVNFSTSTLKKFLDKEVANENLVESFNSVIEPLQKHIVREQKNHPKVTEIFLQLNDLAGQYFSIELQAKHNAGDYKAFAEGLSEKAIEFESASSTLRKDFAIKAK